MAKPYPNAQQLLALQATERVMSVMSLIGSIFIVSTFLRWHFFRKPINRLVFYASFGNIMANLATLISTEAVPGAGEDPTPLCRFQGILIQWFMMADSLWVFCMALNVMLVFFYQFNSGKLRRLEKYYLAFSYGLPFTPALIYVVVEQTTGQRIYGGATIWCWVDPRVEWLRIAFFYGPIWVMVIATMGIYIFTGKKIMEQRNVLRGFSQQKRYSRPPPNPAMPGHYINESRSSLASTRYLTTTIESPTASANRSPTSPRFQNLSWPRRKGTEDSIQKDDKSSFYKVASNYKGSVGDKEAPTVRSMSIHRHGPNGRRTQAMAGNAAAWGYFKVAFLMFAALIIVWVPSTVNRLQQFIDKGHPVFGLNLASAFVLPLQGFWNSMVYISTSWPECKRAIRDLLKKDTSNASQETTDDRRGSEHTLAAQPTDYDSDGPLDLNEILQQNRATPPLHSRLSSSDTSKKSLSSRHRER
ncbi:family A G protein-coupled receptor-like protein [Lophiostoma macrostomum CBS 122681]|uniref:Family A G protein-coupled receptor-like protein n=1 Tax=Lophiostoma macrostomum CBS 122681 TaxID=1314788 RepID=A0A6A6T6W7_9PLEO|nr:family A G protein-coupled receptor-like protein [Lophiostoma macrostomum CBS 122681]